MQKSKEKKSENQPQITQILLTETVIVTAEIMNENKKQAPFCDNRNKSDMLVNTDFQTNLASKQRVPPGSGSWFSVNCLNF